MTKANRQRYHRYLQSIHCYGQRNIYQAYVNPSMWKARAYADCMEKATHYKESYGLTIVSNNCHFFTCAFLYMGGKGETRFHMFTPWNEYDFEVNDND